MRVTAFISTAFFLLAIASCSTNETAAPNPPVAAVSPDSLVKRGSYLVTTMGCDDCHSPKIMGPQGPALDRAHRLSGYPADRPVGKIDASVLKEGWTLFGPDLTSAVGPWGVSFAANITSDSTGIGAWSEAQFAKAMRHGKSKGLDNNRMLLPPMPWQNFKDLTDEDLSALFAFLKSTKPVRNAVPAPVPPTAL